MSIPVLIQVAGEVRRLAIAGSVVASGDFRLKKLLPPLEQAGQKAPVFAKVAEAATKVIESNEKTSAEALLELSTLVNAILYTQGETGVAGCLEPLDTNDLGMPSTQASARMLKPLLESLTSKGSGRLEVIKDAHERGMFRDLRLVSAAISALDDSYPEIADFVAEHVLPLYGKPIWQALRDRFDHRGRGGHVRRLLLMHKFDPQRTRELVMLALDEGSKETKLAAIECLGESPDDLAILLEHVKSKSKDVRRAALGALGGSKHADAAQTLRTAFAGNDREIAVTALERSQDEGVLTFVIESAHDEMSSILSAKEKDKAKVGKQIERLRLALECLRKRHDKVTEAVLLSAFAQRHKFAVIKSEPSGSDIVSQVALLMVDCSEQTRRALVDAHATLSADDLRTAFAAACGCLQPGEVFEQFSPYYTAKIDGKRNLSANPAHLKKQAILAALRHEFGRRHEGWYGYGWEGGLPTAAVDKLDPRWLDLAAAQKDVELVVDLAIPGHEATNVLLASAWEGCLKKKSLDVTEYSIVAAMVRIQHPGAVPALNAIIERCAKKNPWELHYVRRLIPQLPKSALPGLEALVTKLPDQAIDMLVQAITELKNRPDE